MTVTFYGRHKIPQPNAGDIAGPTLESEYYSGFEKIGNNITGRWSGETASLANNATIAFEHNLGLVSTDLSVVIEEGTSLVDPVSYAGRYVITYTDTNNLSVQNVSGAPIANVSFYVFPRRFIAPEDMLMTAITDSTSTGADTTISAPALSGLLRLTQGALSGVRGIAAPTRGRFLFLYNDQAISTTFKNQAGTAAAADRIVTGTSADIVLAPGASLLFAYDTTEARWLLVGGSGGGGYTNVSALNLAAGASISGITSGFNQITVSGSGAVDRVLSTTPLTTTAPLNGTEALFVGTSNDGTITIDPSDIAKGFALAGSVTLSKGSTLTVVYNATLDRWVEKSRSIIALS